MRKLSPALTIPTAEVLASRALGWLAGDPDLFGRFLAETGIPLAAIRAAVEEPEFLAGVLDFLVRHEAALMAFAESEAIPASRVSAAHATLSGRPGLDA